MIHTVLTPEQKARRINLDAGKYGTFAEIGAGQEIARWFFRAGGASGTVAKTISAYDMAVSDAIYGKTRHYVSRERLMQMLDHEYPLLVSRLAKKRGAQTVFFTIADTVATSGGKGQEAGRAWIGIRFQHQPLAKPSQLLLHVRLHGNDPVRQHEAMGLLGVNLLYGALFHRRNGRRLLDSLFDNIARDRLELNMVQFSGPGFDRIDSRLMSLHAVRQGYSPAMIFSQAGAVVQAGEVIYGRSLLVLRGSFQPVTRPVLEIIRQAQAAGLFPKDEEPVELCELSLRDLHTRRRSTPRDFLLRVDMLRAVGKSVLLSRTGPYHLLPAFLRRYTKHRIVFILGLPALRDVFQERYYADLPGGLLEGMGRLFMGDVKLAVYPVWDERRQSYLGAADYRPAPRHRLLYQQLLERGQIVPIKPLHAHGIAPLPNDVRHMIRCKDPAWRKLVPASVVRLIRKNRAFGYHGK